MNLCYDIGISAKKQIGAILKDKFFYCYPNLQGRFSFDAGFKTILQTPLCVSSVVVSYGRVFLQPF